MLGYLVQAHQRQEMAANNLDDVRGRPTETTAGRLSTNDREFVSFSQKLASDDAAQFKLSEKEVNLPEVKEVAESEVSSDSSQSLSSKTGTLEDLAGSKKQLHLDKLQMEIMEAQRKLFRLQSKYND